VVELLAREAREVVHDHEVDLAFVCAAVLQQRLELATVRRLGAFAFFVEAFEDVVREVRERVRTVGRDGGLIVAPAHNFQPDTPVENILAMYETVRRS
jgi:predicted TIM-barrel fold metal-dependent hydrolase